MRLKENPLEITSHILPLKAGMQVDFVSRNSSLGTAMFFGTGAPMEFHIQDLHTQWMMLEPGHYLFTDPHIEHPIHLLIDGHRIRIECPSEVKVQFKDPNPPKEIGASKTRIGTVIRALMSL